MIEEELKTLINKVKKYNLLIGNNNKYKSNILDLFNKPIKDYLDDEDKLFILNSLISKKKECNVVEDDNINNNSNDTNNSNFNNTNNNTNNTNNTNNNTNNTNNNTDNTNNNSINTNINNTNTTPINENKLIFDTLINKLNFNVGDIILYTLDKNNNKYFLSKLDFFKKYIPSLDKIQLNELLIRSIKYDTGKDFDDYLMGLGADEKMLNKRIKTDTNEHKFPKLFREKSSKSCGRDRVLIKYLLEELGHPERKIKNVIHITGSNGKGSTCHFLRYILEEQGYKVNVYTNPSVVHYSENYYIAGEYISDEKYSELFLKVKEAYDRVIMRSDYDKSVKIADDIDLKHGRDIHDPQYDNVLIWTFVVVIMIMAFAESNADFSIIEVRNGGLNDVTNVFSENETIATILTYIQYGIGSNDGTMPIYHEDGSVECSNRATAYHKSMLGKKDRPMIVANQTEDVLEEIRRVAREEVGNYTIEYGREWFVEDETENNFVFRWKDKKIKINKSKILFEDFQTKNIATALATLYTLQEQGKIKIDVDLLQKGVDNTRVNGRLCKVVAGNYIKYFDNSELEIISGFIKYNRGGVDDFMNLFNDNKDNKYTYIIYTANAKKVLKDDIFLFKELKNIDSKKFKLVVYRKDAEVFEYIKEQLDKNNLEYTKKMSLSSALKYVKEDMNSRFNNKKTKSNARKTGLASGGKKIKLFIVCDAMTKFDSNIEYMN